MTVIDLNTARKKITEEESTFVSFHNKGLIHMEAIRTMGISVKKEGAIGFFGTGLKYAIAVLLREKQKVTIYRGLEKFVFGTERETINGIDFDIVTMNGARMGFTTELGKTWKLWMAFRELYCNCKDEGGTITEGETPAEDAVTVVQVEGLDFLQEYQERQRNFLEGKPVFTDGACEMYEGQSRKVFYRGVRIMDLPTTALYTYNILAKIDLTEDRTAKYSFQLTERIATMLTRLDDKRLIRQVVTAPEQSLEGNLEYGGYGSGSLSEEFKETVVKEYQADSRSVNKSLVSVVTRTEPSAIYKDVELSNMESRQLKKVIAFCKKLGYSCDEYTVRVTESMGPVVCAQAFKDQQEIILAKKCFDKGSKFLASTLIEEILHIREGFYDESRELQNYLFDQIISLGEQLLDESL